jgi:riboflavin synthase
MFSGIVEKMGVIRVHDLADQWGVLGIEMEDWDDPVEEGESIATQGICLTVARRSGPVIEYDVLRETFEKTTLGEKKVGQRLNLERSLRWGQPMGGHIVVGHVDGVGRVRRIEQVGRDWKFEVTCSQEILDGVVYKGSIGLDGISLTVAELLEDGFVVHIIPYTYENTTFRDLEEGSGVNLEVDLLAKYVRRLVDRQVVAPEVTWDKLRAEGFLGMDGSKAP